MSHYLKIFLYPPIKIKKCSIYSLPPNHTINSQINQKKPLGLTQNLIFSRKNSFAKHFRNFLIHSKPFFLNYFFESPHFDKLFHLHLMENWNFEKMNSFLFFFYLKRKEEEEGNGKLVGKERNERKFDKFPPKKWFKFFFEWGNFVDYTEKKFIRV